MRVQIDFTTTRFGAHAPYLRLFPVTQADEDFILAQEQTPDGLTGWLQLSMGLRLERRYDASTRRALGTAYYEMWWVNSAPAALVGLSLWLPLSARVEVLHDGAELRPGDQALHDAVQEAATRHRERKRIEDWCADIDRRAAALDSPATPE